MAMLKILVAVALPIQNLNVEQLAIKEFIIAMCIIIAS
jgi:hypothetical protein